MKGNRKTITAIFALSAVFAVSTSAQAQSSTAKQAGLTNPGFEEPRVEEGSFALVETMPGWKTTDTRFEIWSTGFLGVPAHEGTQFVELNAYIDGTLYQDSTSIEAGSVLEFTFAHRGRTGEDTMKLTITDLGADNSLGGGDDTVLFTKEYTTGKDAWAVYDSTKEEQINALGNAVRFAYGAVKSAGGDLKEGNLLDAANFGVGVVSEAAMQNDNGSKTEGATLTFNWSGEVGSDASVALIPGGEAIGNTGWMLDGQALAAETVITFSYTILDTAKDTDGTPGAGRYTGGTLNVSIPSMGVNSTPIKDYHLMFGTDGSSDYVVAQPSDDTGFGLVANWPAKTNPWPNPDVLSTIANPKASNIFGTSPDSKFTLTLKSGHVLTTAFTELFANSVFSSSSSAGPQASMEPTKKPQDLSGEAPPENAMKLDIDGGAFTFGYRTIEKPGFTEFPNTDSPHPGITRRNRADGEYFSYAQNTLETELKAQETSLVHYPAKAEGSGVLCPGQNPGDVAIARFTAMEDGEYHFQITAQLIEEDPTGAGVKIYVGEKVVDKTELAGHLVPWTTTTVVTLEKGQTVDIAVDNGLDKNWEKDHVLISAKAWATGPSISTVTMVTAGDSVTSESDPGEHIITKDLENQKGAVWTEHKIDFSKNFKIGAEIYLGTKDADGADGMALVFQALGNHIVSAGGGLGYQGISPSIVIEFDTYQNMDAFDDPVEDHVGLRTDGDPAHTPTDFVKVENLEDGKYHPITFEWNAGQQTFNLSLDGKQIFKEKSIPENGLAGQQVFFGFTAATGALSNEHKVRSISFVVE